MKNAAVTIFILLFSCLVVAQEKRLALVIGNANYDKGPLRNPVSDARLLAKTLDSIGFDVILSENIATRSEFIRVARDFGVKRDDYDVALVYYAGHGVQVGGENFLLPTKEEFNSIEDVQDFGISVQNIMRYLESKKDQINILILDACRDNPFEQNWSASRSIKGQGLAKIPPPTGSLIAFSTDSGQTAPDGEGQNSVYTLSLAKNMLLEETSIDQVFRNVRSEVLAKTNGAQRPVEATQLTGETFYFNPVDLEQNFEQIQALLNEEKFLEALSIIQSIIDRDGSNYRALRARAKAYYGLKDYEMALSETKNVLELDSLDAISYRLKAHILRDIEDYGLALEAFNKAVALAPDSKDSYYYRALFFENQGDYTKALEDYDKAVAIDPEDLNNLFNRALLYRNNLNNYEKSLQDYLRILTLDTDQEFAKAKYLYNNIAIVYETHIKDYDKAGRRKEVS